MSAPRSTYRSRRPAGAHSRALTRGATIAIALAVVLLSVPLAFLVITWTDGKGDAGQAHVGLSATMTPSPKPSATPTAPPTVAPTRPPTKPPPTSVYYTWALIDRRTGEIRGANLSKTNFSESTVKIWLAADYLNRKGAGGIAVSAPTWPCYRR